MPVLGYRRRTIAGLPGPGDTAGYHPASMNSARLRTLHQTCDRRPADTLVTIGRSGLRPHGPGGEPVHKGYRQVHCRLGFLSGLHRVGVCPPWHEVWPVHSSSIIEISGVMSPVPDGQPTRPVGTGWERKWERKWERALLSMAPHRFDLLTPVPPKLCKRGFGQAVVSVLHSWGSRGRRVQIRPSRLVEGQLRSGRGSARAKPRANLVRSGYGSDGTPSGFRRRLDLLRRGEQLLDSRGFVRVQPGRQAPDPAQGDRPDQDGGQGQAQGPPRRA